MKRVETTLLHVYRTVRFVHGVWTMDNCSKNTIVFEAKEVSHELYYSLCELYASALLIFVRHRKYWTILIHQFLMRMCMTLKVNHVCLRYDIAHRV